VRDPAALVSHAARRQASALDEVAHRPWPLPRSPWIMGQTWDDLLFAHWPLAPAALAAHVPAGLTLDRYDGRAWLGVTPFRISGLRARGLPGLPGLSAFPELNVRTYVTAGGRPGILFFSLDAASRAAVWAARALYHLPYAAARMTVRVEGDRVRYRHARPAGRFPPAAFEARYGPVAPPAPAAPGSLEHFLAERYCLYAVTRPGTLLRADVHHRPWPLQVAEADIVHNTMPPPELPPLGGPPLLHFSRRQDVVVWPPLPVGESQE